MIDDDRSPKEKDAFTRFWLNQLALADKDEKPWRDRAYKLVKRYRDEGARKDKRFNLLWSTIETLKPAVFGAVPEPDIRRRYYDKDPISRAAAEIAERTVNGCNDQYDIVECLEAARDDVLLVGRGQIRAEYDVEIGKRELEPVYEQDPFGNVISVQGFTLDGQPYEPDVVNDDGFFAEVKEHECARLAYVHWADFRMSPAKSWKEVWWVAFRHFMSRSDGVERFGPEFKTVPKMRKEDGEEDNSVHSYGVWEIWDKRKREVIFLADGHHKALERGAPSLDLHGFFPCPPPIYAVKTTDSMIPIPEATLYQDQLDEIDDLTSRIDRLTDALKVRGIYAKDLASSLELLLSGEDNTLVPVDWEGAVEKGRLEGAISFMPLAEVAAVIKELTQRREIVKSEIHEITGVSDILRGVSQAAETATAQRIKGTFATKRLEPRQKPFARFIRDGMRLQAEIACEMFDLETFQAITGLQVQPQVLQLLRDDRLRGYRLDIETDQTVEPDSSEEKAQAIELIQATTGFFERAAPMIQQVPESAPLLTEMLAFAFRRFKAGRELESRLDEFTEIIQQKTQQPQPDPNQAAMQAEQQKMQQQAALEMEKAKMGAQVDMQKAAMSAQTDMQKAQLAAQVDLETALMRA